MDSLEAHSPGLGHRNLLAPAGVLGQTSHPILSRRCIHSAARCPGKSWEAALGRANGEGGGGPGRSAGPLCRAGVLGGARAPAGGVAAMGGTSVSPDSIPVLRSDVARAPPVPVVAAGALIRSRSPLSALPRVRTERHGPAAARCQRGRLPPGVPPPLLPRPAPVRASSWAAFESGVRSWGVGPGVRASECSGTLILALRRARSVWLGQRRGMLRTAVLGGREGGAGGGRRVCFEDITH